MRCVPRILSAINARRGAGLSPHDLEDLTQDTLLRILEKLGTFRGHTTLEYWAHRFCYLEVMNRLRLRGRRAEVTVEAAVEEVPQTTPEAPALDPDELQEWLERMDARESEVLHLRLFEHRDFAAIGKLLGIPQATAKSRYYRGIAWLQERLASLQEERS